MHEVAQQVLADSTAYSSQIHADGIGPTYERDGKSLPYLGNSIPAFPTALGLTNLDAEEHRPYRRALMPLFSPATTARLEPRIRELVTASIDSFIESGHCDLMQDLAAPVPALITMEAIGLAPEQAEQYSQVIHDVATAPAGPEREAAGASIAEMMEQVAIAAQQ